MDNTLLDLIISSLSEDAMRYFFPGYDFRKDYGTIGSRPDVRSAPCCCCRIATEIMADEAQDSESELDSKTQALLDEIEAIRQKYGITIEELEAVLSYSVKLSHLRITRHKAIILDEFDHQEVKMDSLTKAVFLLYLKHPEGIRYKELCDHRSELESIYLSISGRSDLESIRKSICDLTDSINSNSINEKVSRAKKAFLNVVDERIAKFYYIEGKQGAAKRIALDRSFVIWE